MFMDLEKVMPVGVHVVTIAPKLVKGQMAVRLVVAATTDESKLKFLRAIEASPAFSDVQLLSEHGTQNSGDQAMLELNAIYSRS
jgi:hypothetical protein